MQIPPFLELREFILLSLGLAWSLQSSLASGHDPLPSGNVFGADKDEKDKGDSQDEF
jgi:hypothetical protein